MPDDPAGVARNLVLLSDGTGNSSAKLMKTNVWRLYEALDVSTGDQLAMYDNGVGTSSVKLLGLVGGAFGWGLKRNVRDLYMFACRNYQTGDARTPTDRLHAFGFSRGAFTIRVLVGLIQQQGLITGAHGRELKRLAKWAYREYRRQFNSTGGLVSLFRWFRDKTVRLTELGKPRYDKRRNTRARVTFMGLWDTVDAYGLPLDEMTRGWDQWIWPLSMCERKVKNVDKVCHAIALDDERHTFHPVLLDESDTPLHDHIGAETVTQVWFAGVHSNVGGGYPDDSLAHVSLRWMAEQAVAKGLRLHQSITSQWKARVDPHGPVYDSRAGIGSYYRYNPRNIKRLTADRFADVSIQRPKIHHSVFDRILAGRDDYAPIVLPDRYAVVDDQGAVLEGPANPYEHPTQTESRYADQERVWNLVWFRRVLYFATVLLTFVLVLPPLIFTSDDTSSVKRTMEALGVPQPGAAKALMDAIAPLAPSMLQPWVNFYRGYPELLAVIGGLIILLMILSGRVQAAAGDRMRRLWADIIDAPRALVVPHAPPTDIIYQLRSSDLYRRTFEVITQHVFPFVFGVATLAAVVLIVVGTVNRAAFSISSASGNVCEEPKAATNLAGATTVHLRSWELCRPANVRLVGGQAYRVVTELPADGWKDSGELVRSPAGFSTGDNLFVLPFLPFRRVLREQWFVPIARVGVFPSEHHPLNKKEVVFTPRVSGPLFLFVNDVVLAGRWNPFYDNNDEDVARDAPTRVAKIHIERVVPEVVAAVVQTGTPGPR
jgi:uncharacterized protein (DUF2235 family)